MQENKREISLFKKRIIEYLEIKGVTKYECYKNTGMSRSVLSQPNGMTEDNILKFLAYYKDINPAWLLTGEGDIIKSENSNSNFVDNNSTDISEDVIFKTKYYETIEKLIVEKEKIEVLQNKLVTTQDLLVKSQNEVKELMKELEILKDQGGKDIVVGA